MPEVRYASRATRDLTAKLDHVRALNPCAARLILAEIERALATLAEDLIDGPPAPAIPGSRVFVTRKHRYRVIYRRVPGGIVVLRILHPRQDASTLR